MKGIQIICVYIYLCMYVYMCVFVSMCVLVFVFTCVCVLYVLMCNIDLHIFLRGTAFNTAGYRQQITYSYQQKHGDK